MVYVCDAQKTIIAAMDTVRVDVATASVLSERKSIPSVNDEQRKTLAVLPLIVKRVVRQHLKSGVKGKC